MNQKNYKWRSGVNGVERFASSTKPPILEGPVIDEHGNVVYRTHVVEGYLLNTAFEEDGVTPSGQVNVTESLQDIATLYGIAAHDLYLMNRGVIGANPNALRAGMELVIPNG